VRGRGSRAVRSARTPGQREGMGVDRGGTRCSARLVRAALHMRADERESMWRSPPAEMAVRVRLPVDVAVATLKEDRPSTGRRLLGPASIPSPPRPRGAPFDAAFRPAKSALSTERALRRCVRLGVIAKAGPSRPAPRARMAGDPGPHHMPTAGLPAATPPGRASALHGVEPRARGGRAPVSTQPLWAPPYAGGACPDRRRLSTLPISGLCPRRRLA
jgi:hypothetical protein